MGIFARVTGRLGRTGKSPAGTTDLASPWTGDSHLARIVLSDIYGLDLDLPVTRAEAMGVPAIARARNILASDAQRCPLEALDSDGTVLESGRWLQDSASGVSPQHRIAWTVDDLIFHGWSLWVLQRDDAGAIEDAARVPAEWWKFGEDGAVLINDETADAAQVLLIPGFHEGIVASAGRTVRGARQLEDLWQARAANPVPAVELSQDQAGHVTDDEVKKVLDNWRRAMTAQGGAVGWTPYGVTLKTHGEASADLLIQGRNAAAIDAARAVGVPAAMVDASNVNSTLTYETLEGRGGEYLERSLPLYLGAIEARLSLDDVTPAGSRVRANLSALTALVTPATGTPTED